MRPQTWCFFEGAADERFVEALLSMIYKVTLRRPR